MHKKQDVESSFTSVRSGSTVPLQGKQRVQGAYALVRGGSSTPNLFETKELSTSCSLCNDVIRVGSNLLRYQLGSICSS